MIAVLGWLFGSTPGRVLIGVVIFMTWLWRHDLALEARVRGECQAEQLRQTIAEIERQKTAAQRAVEESEKAQAVADARIAALEKERVAINDSIPVDTRKRECRVPRNATDRVRNIR